MHRKILYFLLFLALVPALTMAGTKGRIKGTVVDLQTGEPLIGANVIVVGSSIGAATDANGEFILLNLEASVYDLKVSYLGYQTVTLTGVRVNADLTTYVTFELPDEDVQVGTVEIVATKPLIQKDATNKVRITTSEDIDALPVRGVNNIIGLTAGVIIQDNSVFIRGGRADEVGYFLEGVKINNAVTGSRAVSLTQDALEEIQIQSGGYTAEFGGANAGIIRQQLKSGSSNFKASLEYITDNVGFKSKDDFFDGEKTLGAYTWGYNELSASFSGSVLQNVKYFVNVNNVYWRDVNPQPWPGIDLGPIAGLNDTLNFTVAPGPRINNSQNTYTYTGTLNFDFNPFLIRLTGVYSDITSDNPGVFLFNEFNPRGGITEISNGNFSAKLTHVLSSDVFYEISAGYYLRKSVNQDPWLKDNYWAYGDSVANAEVGWVWQRSNVDIAGGRTGQYVTPRRYDIMGLTYTAYGTPVAQYTKTSENRLTLSGALSLNVGKVHAVKLGGEYIQETIRRWDGGLNGVRGFASQLNQGLTEKEILLQEGVNNFGYDIFGNETDDGLYAPHKPVTASAYIQDRIEFQDIILNLGLRYDYIDIDNMELKTPENPVDFHDKLTREIFAEGLKEVPSFSSVSPRIGFSFPVTDQTVFHAQFGKFVQQTRYRDIYVGYHRLARELRGGRFFTQPYGANIRPTRTTQYELGFSQTLSDFLSMDITGYYRDIKGQVVFTLQQTVGGAFQDYNTLSNGDFATTKGLEINLSMRRYKGLTANANISFQDAQGTGSNPFANAGIVGAPQNNTVFVPQYISVLSFNQAVTGNINLDYRFSTDSKISLLSDLGISGLLTFGSGHPYTRGVSGAINAETDSRFREPIEPLNSSTTPPTWQFDLRIDKTFNLFEGLKANIYMYVINLFDVKNEINVFLRTGTTTDDGYVSDPEISKTLVDTYGDLYLDYYNAVRVDYQHGYGGFAGGDANFQTNFLYGPPRQIRLGIRLEY